VPQILAAGAEVSLLILVLGLTGWIEKLEAMIPRAVVRGIQLSLGLALTLKGAEMALGSGQRWGPDSHATAALACVVLLGLSTSRRLPAALVLFILGAGLAVLGAPGTLPPLQFGLHLPHWSPPALADFISAFPRAALPQIPLTTLNSVVAVCALSKDLFPKTPAPLRRVAVSVGLMNLLAAPFGGMPMCHGAGGLAGQQRFGARTNGSILFLGALKIAVALLFGASLMALCRAFPGSVLGVMLAASGWGLAQVAGDQRGPRALTVTLLTGLVSLACNNVALGFAAGLVLAWILRPQQQWPLGLGSSKAQP
jgi:MFS superfamily sulfate permease-like transporter